MRIVAFGCSFTYGHGLPDCYDMIAKLSGSEVSKLAWPQILANELNADCVNMSSPGSSNKEILNSVLNFNFDTSDIVIIMWSFIDRWCTLIDHKSISKLVFDNSVDAVLQYDKVFTITDLQLDFIYRANFAKLYLDNKNLKNYHMSVKPEECFPTVVPQWNTVDFSNVSMTNIQRYTAPALDGTHPGIEAHSILAIQLYNELFDTHNK